MLEEVELSPSRLLARMREAAPLVQCITNHVAMNLAANTLLATGASPAMVEDVAEAGEFARIANALTINIGTLSSSGLDGMTSAIQGANAAGKPWVLDPVAHFATAFRRKAVGDLLTLKPTIIRGNASEILALGGGQGSGRGVDSGDTVEQAGEAARTLALKQNAIVAVTGPTDLVTDGSCAVRVYGGSALMPRVTAMGCALTCLVGAFAAVASKAPLQATVAALGVFAVAGETAAERARGPGSFVIHFLDALYALDAETLETRVQIELQR